MVLVVVVRGLGTEGRKNDVFDRTMFRLETSYQREIFLGRPHRIVNQQPAP